ncbi:RhoGAP-domain-containing protein [Dendrothele bispora CBS 962.96]|uniref:RhoGAP-domain-containing protein n=1 Tax=Dendrothele bispora (strain CBS 962.96) TaxID=1314807 RepID=A0A4S8MBZ1_DENBC|nr:RhoGAP-domain-containing protein [Dendrothele bispora CBS 962.96]
MAPNNLTLKQRLAALSVSPSSPSSPQTHAFLDSVSSPRRKTLFTPPWVKRSNETLVGNGMDQNGHEILQEVMTRMIFQAGVDFETRPMVVMNASAMPDPKEVNYDLLLSRILSYLNLYVESDYTVVFFAAGGRHTPGWNWVWKAYRSLSRKYRKNLKRLYIVHSSFFSKMLFSLAGAIISPKFFRKLAYIDTLSELAYHVPLTQIDIPPAVYQENLKHESRITLPDMHSSTSSSAAFGVPLEDVMGYQGEKGPVPRVVRDCIQFLRDSGLNEEGLFRRSPSSQLLRAAQEAYDRGQVVSLEIWQAAPGGGPHLAAVLLKKYLRDLPNAIFGEELYALVRRCPAPTSDPGDVEAVRYVREVILPELPPCVYILLSHILHLMHEVSLRSASNRMDAHNLAVVLTPNLVKGSNPVRDVQMCVIPASTGPTTAMNLFPRSGSSSNPSSPLSSSPHTPSTPAAISENRTTLGMVIKLCIQRYYEVFDEFLDRGEIVGVGYGDSDPYGVGYRGNHIGLDAGGHASAEASVEGSREGSVERGGGPQEEGRASLSFRAVVDDASGAGDSQDKPPQTRNGFASASGVLGNGMGRMKDGNETSSTKRTGSSNSLTVPSLLADLRQHHRRKSSALSGVSDISEDIDDDILVMPIGPSGSFGKSIGHNHTQSTPETPTSPSFSNPGSGPPSSWVGAANTSTFRPKHRTTLSGGSATSRYSGSSSRGAGRSIHTVDYPPGSGGTLSGPPSSFTIKPKARSMISVDSGSLTGTNRGAGGWVGTVTKKGSISVGRGTNRQTGKGIGAGVEAIGITAEGFFTAPSGIGSDNPDARVGKKAGDESLPSSPSV